MRVETKNYLPLLVTIVVFKRLRENYLVIVDLQSRLDFVLKIFFSKGNPVGCVR